MGLKNAAIVFLVIRALNFNMILNSSANPLLLYFIAST